MIEVIEAEAPIIDTPEFDTAGEAIEHAKRSSINASLDGFDVSAFVGETVEQVDWSDNAFCLHLASGRNLRLGLCGGKVDVLVQELADLPGDKSFASSVVVHLGSLRFVWKRGELLRRLCGHKFSRLQLSGGAMGNFLYVKDAGILHLGALIERASRRSFLFWDFSD